jgi:hypothetical protein
MGVILKKVFDQITSLGLLLVTRETIQPRGTPTNIMIRTVNITVNASFIIRNNVKVYIIETTCNNSLWKS